ncbi:MAG: nitroreductase family deazaflavin-dependent oxidoreductase [Candidatus Nanopelagicales bacterium]
MTRILRLLALLALVVATLGLVWLLGMRRKDSAVVALQRRVNRAVINPRQRAIAGRPGSDAALLHHVGRTSGRAYATPVGAEPTTDGFSIALVYGPRSDWLRNVLAAGSARIDHDGRTYAVDRPEVVAFADAEADFPPKTVPALRMIGVQQVLRLHRVDDGTPTAPDA